MADPAVAPDPALAPPLLPFAGAEPPAPAWFREAVATPHERRFTDVEGARSDGRDLLVDWRARHPNGHYLTQRNELVTLKPDGNPVLIDQHVPKPKRSRTARYSAM